MTQKKESKALNVLKKKVKELKKKEKELKAELTEIKRLSGILTICANCKKIRDENESWQQIEEYIRDCSEAEFSHGICPDCAKKLYPEFCK